MMGLYNVTNAGLARGVLETLQQKCMSSCWKRVTERSGNAQTPQSNHTLSAALDSSAAPEGEQLSDLNLSPGNHPDNDVNKTSRALSAQGRERDGDDEMTNKKAKVKEECDRERGMR